MAVQGTVRGHGGAVQGRLEGSVGVEREGGVRRSGREQPAPRWYPSMFQTN